MGCPIHVNRENDLHYIKLVLAGDTEAFSELITRYKDMVFTLALRITKNQLEAEEVSQDTFLRAFKYLSKFKNESKFSSWIYRITYNTAMDKIQRRKREIQTDTLEEITAEDLKLTEHQLDRLEAQEKSKAIQSALAELNEEDGFLLTLYYFDDLTIEEISSITKLKRNNVKVKLFRARNKLAKLLRRKLEPEIIENYGN